MELDKKLTEEILSSLNFRTMSQMTYTDVKAREEAILAEPTGEDGAYTLPNGREVGPERLADHIWLAWARRRSTLPLDLWKKTIKTEVPENKRDRGFLARMCLEYMGVSWNARHYRVTADGFFEMSSCVRDEEAEEERWLRVPLKTLRDNLSVENRVRCVIWLDDLKVRGSEEPPEGYRGATITDSKGTWKVPLGHLPWEATSSESLWAEGYEHGGERLQALLAADPEWENSGDGRYYQRGGGLGLTVRQNGDVDSRPILVDFSDGRAIRAAQLMPREARAVAWAARCAHAPRDAGGRYNGSDGNNWYFDGGGQGVHVCTNLADKTDEYIYHVVGTVCEDIWVRSPNVASKYLMSERHLRRRRS